MQLNLLSNKEIKIVRFQYLALHQNKFANFYRYSFDEWYSVLKLFRPTQRKIVLSDQGKTFANSRTRPRIYINFEITRTIYLNSEMSDQFYKLYLII